MPNATGCGEIPARETDLWTGEVATLAGVTKMTIVRWANSGRLPCSRTLGGETNRGDRRFHPYDVAELLMELGRPIPADIMQAWRIRYRGDR